ncbi:hypothetical protein [Immundisolibacter sp.]
MSQHIEDAESQLEWPQPQNDANLGHAAASVTLAAAALEAAVNEVYLRAVDQSFSAFPKLNRAEVRLLAELWEVVESSRAQTIKKHELALAALNKPEISRGTSVSQDAASLLELRDLLMHFKPEWEDELDRHRKVEGRLRGKFAENQLSARATGRMLWFPGRCLGAGCAIWAVQSASRYHEEFVESLGATSVLPPF